MADVKSETKRADLAVRLAIDGDLTKWEARTANISPEKPAIDEREMFHHPRSEAVFQVSGQELSALVKLASAGYAAQMSDPDRPPNLEAIMVRCYDTVEMRRASRRWAKDMTAAEFSVYMLQEARSDIFHLVETVERARKALEFYERECAAASETVRNSITHDVYVTLASPEHALAKLRGILGKPE